MSESDFAEVAFPPAHSGYLELRGQKIWSNEWANNGEAVLILHGGLSHTARIADYVLPTCANNYHPFGYDRTAHGRTAMREGFYHFTYQRDEAIAYLEDVVQEPAHLIGHSDGGIIALMVALSRPDLVRSITAIGANFHYDCGLAAFEEEVVISEEEIAEYSEISPDPIEMRKRIVEKAYEVWRSEPSMTTEELARIHTPVLVLNGDDEPFDTHHGVDLYHALPNARLAIVPGASHAVLKDKTELTQYLIATFLENHEFPITRAPNRRAARQAQLMPEA